MLQKTIGLVLHVTKYNDTSNIIDMYTELCGRCSYLVSLPRTRRAAVKPMLFQPLSFIEFEADYRPTASLHKIREAKSFYPFASIPYDPYKSAIGLFLAEFLYRTLREESENYPLFSYLKHSIVWLDTCNGAYANFHLVFLMRLSRFMGLYPNLDDYHEGDYFDLQNACFTSVRPLVHTAYIAPDEAARIHKLMRMNYDTMYLFRMNRMERNRFLSVIMEYYRLHLADFPQLKSLGVLQELFE